MNSLADTRILVFAGSARTGSLNARLAALGAAAIRKTGATADLISLADYPLPIYNGDLEKGQVLPPAAMTLKALFKAHHGLLVVSPEYNASVSPLLKNAIDWVSRPLPDENGKVPYKGKVVGMMSVSIAGLGGSRGLAHLRHIFTTLGSWVLPEQVGLASASNAFADDGSLRDAAQHSGLEAFVAALVDATARIGVASGAST